MPGGAGLPPKAVVLNDNRRDWGRASNGHAPNCDTYAMAQNLTCAFRRRM